jgi:purine-nucleoside phosphorylase
MAAGILDQPLNHDEVMETSEKVKESFALLIRGITRSWPV